MIRFLLRLQMLAKDRKERLGQKGDMDDILSHPFFSDINVADLLKKKVTPPFVPKIDNSKDLSNFDANLVQENLTESIIPSAAQQII